MLNKLGGGGGSSSTLRLAPVGNGFRHGPDGDVTVCEEGGGVAGEEEGGGQRGRSQLQLPGLN